MRRKYTVLLLYPDYMADNYGHETYLAHVEAKTVPAAIFAARKQVVASAFNVPSIVEGRCNDLHVLAVFEGHLPDLKP
jgi:hypothetical protein